MIVLNEKPLSVNQAWKGKRFRTQKYKDWCFRCITKLDSNSELIGSKYIFYIDVYYSNSASDIDNCLKPFFDLLQKKYEMFDDKNVYSLVINKRICSKGQDRIEFIATEFKDYITPEQVDIFDTFMNE